MHSLEVAISLEAALDKLAELFSKPLLVEEVVHTQAAPARLGGVRRTDALLGCADRGAAELDLLETIDDLMEVEDEVRT